MPGYGSKYTIEINLSHKEYIINIFATSTEDGSGKTFWGYCEIIHDGYDDIMLKEGDCIVTDPIRVSAICSEYFSRVTESIGKPDSVGADESVATIINRHSKHPGKAIRISMQTHRNLSLPCTGGRDFNRI